ncbi:hypothetical protein [Bradyrhizobium sp. BRP56]|uniref:hypothetical protein n=1 Tax=Bradyrhizobium sp. BRP56 TaxID=2793819 RepID=UPI001CD72767|nr:hypothetical protein [Bradyrhizobium sp. BRP56]MCA1401108.1 hypothetical protein [Bradyrhizobium sp. BRP56]
MMIANRTAQTRATIKPHANGETYWLLAVTAAFLVIHLVAWTILGHASRVDLPDSQLETIGRSCD